MNKIVTNGRITKWILLLWEFNITIFEKTRNDNTVAYFLSRIQNTNSIVHVEDNFPYEHFFF